VGFERGLGGPSIPDETSVLANRPPVIDTPVSEDAVRAPVGSMLPSQGGRGLPTGSQRGAMSDLGGLVDPSRLCSSPVLLGNFVPPREYFGDSMRGAIDPVSPTISVRGGGYIPDVKRVLPLGMENLFPSPTEFEMGNCNVSTPQGLPMSWRNPIATQVPHPGSNRVCYTPVSSGQLATYKTLCSAGWGNARHSGHRVRFEHASLPDTAIGGIASPVPANLPTFEVLSTHGLWNARSSDMVTPKPRSADSWPPVYPDPRPGPLPKPGQVPT
jgi:hypothetical protein